MAIQFHFVEELNLAEIVEVLLVSVPCVHQLKAQALETGLSVSCQSASDGSIVKADTQALADSSRDPLMRHPISGGHSSKPRNLT